LDFVSTSRPASRWARAPTAQVPTFSFSDSCYLCMPPQASDHSSIFASDFLVFSFTHQELFNLSLSVWHSPFGPFSATASTESWCRGTPPPRLSLALPPIVVDPVTPRPSIPSYSIECLVGQTPGCRCGPAAARAHSVGIWWQNLNWRAVQARGTRTKSRRPQAPRDYSSSSPLQRCPCGWWPLGPGPCIGR
jgi:hypothetical protein